MSWERYDDSGTRWHWDDDNAWSRHLLVLAAGELREYDENPDGLPTVHVYVPNPHALDHGAPLDGAEHATTYTVAVNFAPWVRALDDFELIEWLEDGKYADATGGAA